MMNMINRRQFVKHAALCYGSLLLLPGCMRGTEKGHLRVFTKEEAECLGCICEQFIPTDDFAGAREAGVVNFIDKLLYQRFPELTEPYSLRATGLGRPTPRAHANGEGGTSRVFLGKNQPEGVFQHGAPQHHAGLLRASPPRGE